MDRFNDAINQIKTNERVGREECVLDSTKLVKEVLEVMKRNDYVRDYEEFTEGKFKKIRVKLSKKINSIGVVKPRFAVSYRIIQRYETRYIPSRDFGILVISTSKGVMTNKELKEARIGGRLIAYVY
jgi:small subunit ribosomal protein S8